MVDHWGKDEYGQIGTFISKLFISKGKERSCGTIKGFIRKCIAGKVRICVVWQRNAIIHTKETEQSYSDIKLLQS